MDANIWNIATVVVWAAVVVVFVYFWRAANREYEQRQKRLNSQSAVKGPQPTIQSPQSTVVGR